MSATASSSVMNPPVVAWSPGGSVYAGVTLGADGRLCYFLVRDDRIVIDLSPLGITVDGIDLGAGVSLGRPELGLIDEPYRTRGWHTEARNHCCVWVIPVTHDLTGIAYSLEMRLFDDGLAFRYIVPGEGRRVVAGERSGWAIPARSKVWIAERDNDWKLKSYAGWWMATDAESLPTISRQGPVQGPPLVIELPDRSGFAAITEAALFNYSGMRLRAVGGGLVQADFTEGMDGFCIEGRIVTPWRVTLATADLNGLVNSDLLTSLSPAPSAALFADQSWIKPGRAVWRWWSRGTGTPGEEKQFVRYANEIGFEYSLVDDGWEAWPDKWNELKAVCAYASAMGVRILVWKAYKEIGDPAGDYAQLREFLDRVKAAGVSGVKIDFFNAESKEKIDCQLAAFHETARRKLVLLFHGCQKPTGESRTWPHELTREGIRGLELNKMAEGPITAAHNAALPFTRYVTGHADYTPVGYSNPGDTTWAHQLATAVVFTSPLNVIAEDPEFLLGNPAARPALDVLKRLPTVWDQTRVLEPSEIGKLAIFARRSGRTWFLAAINGTGEERALSIDLSFLGDSPHDALLLAGDGPCAFARSEIEGVTAVQPLEIVLRPVDGFAAVFTPSPGR